MFVVLVVHEIAAVGVVVEVIAGAVFDFGKFVGFAGKKGFFHGGAGDEIFQFGAHDRFALLLAVELAEDDQAGVVADFDDGSGFDVGEGAHKDAL